MAIVTTERQMVFTTKLVDEATDKINDGIVVKRYQNPWLKSEVGLRRAGVSFRMTPDEQQEYVRCALDVHYFVEKYCKVKREDGSAKSKIGKGITSIKQQLGEVEKFVNWYSKLKTENGVTKDDYYKRTHKSLHKIKERLMNLSEKIRTL
jgi:hypothetical protein